ncbi:MAG: hypothetical protein K1X47_16735, partial [Cyclobacteriaceae bacterium]|nr:hypothetical protein [Cyclobacteriaceae bacterium]
FRDGSIGKVSEVFDLNDSYVVAVMTSEVKKGYKSLDKVRDEITPLVRNELAGKLIAEKLAKATGTLDELKNIFGADASVYSTSDLKLNAATITGAGVDPGAIGKAFSLEGGKRSTPYIGENGVFVFEMKNLTLAPEIGDFGMFRNQLLQSINNRGAYYIAEAIKDAAKIEDERYKFY